MERFINALTDENALNIIVFVLCAFFVMMVFHLAKDATMALFSSLGGLLSGSSGSKSGSRGKGSSGSKGGSKGKSGGSRGGSSVTSGAGAAIGGTLSGVGAIAKGVGEGVGAAAKGAGKGAGKRMSQGGKKGGSDGGAGIGGVVGGFIGGVIGAAVGGTWAATKAVGSKAKAKAQAANTRFEQSAQEAGREEAQAERPTTRRQRKKQRRQENEVIDAEYTVTGTEQKEEKKLSPLVAVVETDNDEFIDLYSAQLFAFRLDYQTEGQGYMTVFLVDAPLASFASELAQSVLAELDGHSAATCPRCGKLGMIENNYYCYDCRRELTEKKGSCQRCKLPSITHHNPVLGLDVCAECDALHPLELPELPTCQVCGEPYAPKEGSCCLTLCDCGNTGIYFEEIDAILCSPCFKKAQN